MSLETIARADAADRDPPALHPSIALAPFVESLISGRRVAVLGDATLGLAEALVLRGARLVHAYDPDAARVAEALARKAPSFGSAAAGKPAARGVVHALFSDDLGVRDGAFDTVLIPDLSAFPDRAEVVRRAKRLVAHTGAVVLSSPNPEAKRRLIAAEAPSGGHGSIGYYELFDLLSLQFPVVRMVGQAPFVGYAIVDFAPDREPEVSFDASLMAGTEEPESFVAIASERPVATDPYLVVEVPAADVLERAAAPISPSAGPSSARDVHRSPNDHVQLAEMQARLVLMEAELDDLRSQKGDLQRQMDAALRAAEEAEARAREAREESQAHAREAAKAADAQAGRFREMEARAGDEHVRAERLTHKVRDLDEELVRQRDRAQKLTKQIDDEKRARQKAEIELGMTRGLTREGEPDPAVRIDELAGALRNSKLHADSLASELLAKSKETAELRRELEASEEKNVEITRALHAAQVRLDDMEQEAQTLRRPVMIREPVVVASEVQGNMVARMTRLEAEAHAEKLAAEESRREADESKRALQLTASLRDAAVARAEKLQKELDQERSERKDLVIAKAALEAEAGSLRKRIEALSAELEAAPEVTQLEAALRDRGHRIASLERDLRESERIGRELVAEIESLRVLPGSDGGGGSGGSAANGQGTARVAGAGAHGFGAAQAAPPQPAQASGVSTLSADAFQHRIDALAADAARKQAELLTSTWKIQALERELSETRASHADPSLAQRELSSALVHAQSEIADLRRALQRSGIDPSGVPRAVIEDAVLLHQQTAR